MKLHPIRSITFCLAVALLCPPISSKVFAATTNLTPVADTTLRNAAADTSFGVLTSLPVGVSAGGTSISHGLFKFPIEQIPANATVTQVTLQLASMVSNPNTMSTANYQLFRMLRDWNEPDSTWNTRLAPATTWGSPGGQANVDYVSAASGAALIAPSTIGGPSLSLFSSAGLLSDVQLWRTDPGTNFGWMLIAENELAASGKQIASREDLVNTPVLTITYTLPAPPPLLFDVASVGNQLRFSFAAVAAQAYLVEFRTNLTTHPWEPLQNISAPPVDTIIHVTNNIGGDERYFRVKLDEAFLSL